MSWLWQAVVLVPGLLLLLYLWRDLRRAQARRRVALLEHDLGWIYRARCGLWPMIAA